MPSSVPASIVPQTDLLPRQKAETGFSLIRAQTILWRVLFRFLLSVGRIWRRQRRFATKSISLPVPKVDRAADCN